MINTNTIDSTNTKTNLTIIGKISYYTISRINITENNMKAKNKNMMKNKMTKKKKNMTKNKMMRKKKNTTKNKMMRKKKNKTKR